jgi:glycosyltransferase involved in cell wall biosynthesis
MQEFTKWEILIVDNRSKDNTLQLVRNYNDARISILSERDNGLYDAMNKGIMNGKGNWLYFLGAGDTLYSNTLLSIIWKITKDSNIEIIQGDIVIKTKRYRDKLSGIVLLERNFCHQGLFYKRTVFDKTGLYNLSYPILSDWEFNIRWFFNRKIKRLYINELLCNYMGKGLSSQKTDEKFHSDKDQIIKKQFHLNYSLQNIVLLQSFKIFMRLSKPRQKRLKNILQVS